MDIRINPTDTIKCFLAHDAQASMAVGTVCSRGGGATMFHCVPFLPLRFGSPASETATVQCVVSSSDGGRCPASR